MKHAPDRNFVSPAAANAQVMVRHNSDSFRAAVVMLKQNLPRHNLRKLKHNVPRHSLLGCVRFRELERGVTDSLHDGTAADALRANSHGLARTVGRGHMDLLKIRPELPPADPGYLRTHPAKVFGLPAMGHLIAQGGLLSADFTLLGHSQGLPVGTSPPREKTLSIPIAGRDARGIVRRNLALPPGRICGTWRRERYGEADSDKKA
jgi:hypothetical protein